MARFELELENATLFGRERGAGSPVVFLHAGVCDHRMWTYQLDDISDDFHAIAYDRRGFGHSDSDDVQYDDVDDLAALLDHFEAQRAVLVGCSMGGLGHRFCIATPVACVRPVFGRFFNARRTNSKSDHA